ncbi:MAG: GNAT family N-acetyltransferase [Pirellulaceae bacterium]
MRILPPTSQLEARFLIDRLSGELAARYGLTDDGSGDYEAAQEDSDRSVFIVGWLGNSPVACGAIRPLTDDVAELKRMFVLPEHRDKRLAPRILQRLELEANRLGYCTIRLETGDRQPEAIALYQKSGYRQIPPFGKYVSSEKSLL